MSGLRRAVRRLLAGFTSRRADHELEEEMAAHLAMAADENRERGLSPEEARRQAGIAFGGVERARGGHRDARGFPWLEALAQDLRFALRGLRRDWAFAAVAIVILGLGIGANTAVFSVVDALWLRPLPFQSPQQLTWIADGRGLPGTSAQTFTVAGYEQYKRESQSFQAIAAYNPNLNTSEYTLTGYGQPVPVAAVMVSDNFFQTLGVQPRLGRLFTAAATQAGSAPVALLSYGFWQRQFAGDPGIVGQVLTVSGWPVTVVGVMPASFDFGSVFAPGVNINLFIPARMDNLRHRGNTLALIGRRRPGVSVGQAQAEANSLVPRLHEEHPDAWYLDAATLTGLQDHVSGSLRRLLEVLWFAVGLILLIACVNLANLLLARAAGRQQEFAVRLAMGANRARLVRQLLTEVSVLAAGGAVLGAGLAGAMVAALAHQGVLALPLLSRASVNATALGWTVLIAILAVLLAGLLPCLRLGAGRLSESLKDSRHGASESRRRGRLRTGLAISEIALALVLLASAGLLLRSFLQVLDVDLGFEPSHASAIKITYHDDGNNQQRGPVLRQIVERVRHVPGIEAAGISDMLPLGRNRSWSLSPHGVPPSTKTVRGAFVFVVTPGYLHAMGIPLLEGRRITWHDNLNSRFVLLINQAAARRFWPGQDPVGRTARVGGMDVTVIGVVGNVRETSLERDAGPEMYVSASQYGPEGANLVVRSRLPAATLGPEVMRVLRQLNPAQPAETLKPLDGLVSHVTSPRRFAVWLVGSFAILGLLLAALGIYGVISYGVVQRRQEIGIRMALGATPRKVQAMVLRSTLRLALLGIAIGAGLALLAAGALTPLLYGVGAGDPATYAGAIALLFAIALLAGYIPARRAAHVDPMTALREN